MKRFPIVLGLVLAVLALAPSITQRRATRSYGIALAPGDPAPSVRGTSPAGEPVVVRWEDHALTLVNFWASWCVPCKAEMPVLQGLHDRRGQDGLEIVGVEMGAGKEQDGRRFLSDLGIKYPVVREQEDTVVAWGGVAILPTTFFVDRDGKILRKYVGAAPAQLEAMVKDVGAILDGRPLGVQPDPAAAPVPAGKP